MEEQSPAEALPHAEMDTYAGHAMFRNRWRDQNDIIVTAQLKNTKGNGTTVGGPVLVMGLDESVRFPVDLKGTPNHFAGDKNGGSVSIAGASLGVDFRGTAGCDAVVVLAADNIRGSIKAGDVAGGKIRTQVMQAGGTTYVVMTLSSDGKHPELTGNDQSVLLDKTPIRYDGEKIEFGQ